jgi:putative phage-type endonuclease
MDAIQIQFDRNKGLGGSDIPALLGLSKWKSPLALYLEKINESNEPLESSKHEHLLNMGNMLEPYVIDSFEKDTGQKITRRQERIFHPTYDFLWATIDGMCGNLVFEVKTTSSLVCAWKKGLPPYVQAQVAYYSYLTNSDGAKIVVLFRDTGEIKTYDYKRDVEKEKEIIAYAVDFWDKVCKKSPPQPFDYAETQLLYKHAVVDKKATASIEDIEAISRMVQLKNDIKKREVEFDALKTAICIKIGDAAIMEDSLGECLVTWKERSGSRVSTDILKRKYPQIYNECLSKTTTRTFNFKMGEMQNDV